MQQSLQNSQVNTDHFDHTKQTQKKKNVQIIKQIFYFDQQIGHAICQICPSFTIMAQNILENFNVLYQHVQNYHNQVKSQKRKIYSFNLMHRQRYINQNNCNQLKSANKYQIQIQRRDFENQLMHFIPQKQVQQIKNQKHQQIEVNYGARPKRSYVWNFYEATSVKNCKYAICKVCKNAISRGKGSSTTLFWRHIQKQHKQVLDIMTPFQENNLSMNTKSINKNSINKNSIKKQSIKKQSIKKYKNQKNKKLQISQLDQYNNVPCQQSNKQISEQYISFKDNTDNHYMAQIQKLLNKKCLDILTKLKQSHPSIVIIQFYNQYRKIYGFSIETQQIEINAQKYSDSIILIIQQLRDFYIIIFFGQNQSSQPTVLGISACLIRSDNQLCDIIQAFCIKYQYLSQIPQQLIITANSSISERLQKISQISKIELKYVFINIEQIFQKDTTESIISFIKSKMKENCNKIPFYGFILAQKYLQKLKAIVKNCEQFRQLQLQDYLIHLLNISSYRQQTKIQDQIQVSIQNLLQIFVNKFIGQKIEIATLASKQIILKKITQYKFEAINQPLTDFSSQMQFIHFNFTAKKWQCSCGILNLTGVPCPHLIKLLVQTNKYTIFNLIKFINPRWFTVQQYEQLYSQSDKAIILFNNSYKNVRQQLCFEEYFEKLWI